MMSIEVRIPTPLRKYTANLDAVEVDGENVAQALSSLTESHPELKSRIFTDDGKVRRFVNIFANDEDIRFQDNLETPLADGDSVSIVPAIAGGSK
jgi:MoaD family protein